jgi:hypothetical protein
MSPFKHNHHEDIDEIDPGIYVVFDMQKKKIISIHETDNLRPSIMKKLEEIEFDTLFISGRLYILCIKASKSTRPQIINDVKKLNRELRSLF